MIIAFILNGEDVTVNVNAEARLADVLRKNFNLAETKAGCYAGTCGSCSALLDGSVVKSCLVPAFKIAGSEIITIEGFAQTEEYQDIVRGFADQGVENCGFCDAGKILAAEALLNRNQRPAKEEILRAFSEIKCRCTEPEGLVRALTKAAEFRRRRLHGRS